MYSIVLGFFLAFWSALSNMSRRVPAGTWKRTIKKYVRWYYYTVRRNRVLPLQVARASSLSWRRDLRTSTCLATSYLRYKRVTPPIACLHWQMLPRPQLLRRMFSECRCCVSSSIAPISKSLPLLVELKPGDVVSAFEYKRGNKKYRKHIWCQCFSNSSTHIQVFTGGLPIYRTIRGTNSIEEYHAKRTVDCFHAWLQPRRSWQPRLRNWLTRCCWWCVA